MDEASQISVEMGALVLMCARNAVIVGDSMQLPNVITDADRPRLQAIGAKHAVDARYNCAGVSFLGIGLPGSPQRSADIVARTLSLPPENHQLLQPEILWRATCHYD